MYIVGIEPKSPGLHIFGQTYSPRLGLPLLATIAEKMGHACKIFCEEISPIFWPDIARANMILISSITSTAPRAYSLIPKIRELNSQAPILMGGPHCTFLPEEVLAKGVDYVFRHEADESFPQFIDWYVTDKTTDGLLQIRGLSFILNGEYIATPDSAWVDLDTLPTPNFELIHGFKNPKVLTVITSRGCPWNCEFCSEIAMFGRQYRFRSTAKVIKDIRKYHDRYGKVSIFFGDDNIAANPIRLRELCRGLIGIKKMISSYSGQVRLDIAKDPRNVALMRQANFDRFYIGYESTNDASLMASGKGITYAEMVRYTKEIHRQGIMIHAMWVIGFDDDSLETIKENVKASIRLRLETSQFLILVPIPGAAIYDRYKTEKRIFSTDWSKFDGHHVTFMPKNITARQLQIAVMLKAMPKIYSLHQTMKLFVLGNWELLLGRFRQRKWQPFHELRMNFLTLFARIWGRNKIRQYRKIMRKYLKQLP